ncbi:MAG TPA: 2'-5' RNA ligase family protein [Aldersonia sp.]
MVQSVELLFDPDTDARLRRQWQLLLDAGLPSQGHNRSESNRPHVTIAVAREIWPRIEKDLARVAFAPFQVRIGGVLVFGRRQAIVTRSVVPSDALLALHRAVHDVVAGCPGVAGHSAPGDWSPHVTLTRRVRADQLGAVIATVLGEPELVGEAVGVRRWDGEGRREWRVH